MENINQTVFNRVANLRKFVGPDFIAASAYVTYLTRQAVNNVDFFDLGNCWISGDILGSVRALEDLSIKYKNDKGNKNYILCNVLTDICQVLMFFGNTALAKKEEFKRELASFIEGVSNEEIADIVEKFVLKNDRFSCNTSISVCDLSRKLLKINSNDSVADLCCGQGTFLSRVNETKKLYGCDVNFDSLLNAFKVCSVKGKEVEFEQQDLLTRKGASFDKIFMEYPWGYIYQRPLELLHSEKWSPLPVGDLKRSMTSWLFIAKALSSLNENGIAVIHVNDGALSSTYENDIRKKAIELGLVKAVIALPNKINSYTNIRTSLLVLSYNNENVHFVDASNMGTINKQTKEVRFSEADIDHICELVDSDNESEISSVAHHLNLVVEGRNLDVHFAINPMKNAVKIADGKKLDDVKETFIRSVVMNTCYLTDDSTTGIKVLSSSDIKDGYVDVEQLPYLSEEGIEHLIGKWKENLVQDGDVVMTNKSTTIKSAVIKTNGEQIILFGSLVGIRLNIKLINPDYLSAFINSNAGQALLRSIQTGATIQMITLNNLRELTIPCPSLEKQNKLVEDLEITLQMIRDSKDRILKLQKEYEGSFDSLFVEE